MPRIPPETLRRLRNEIHVRILIEHHLKLPAKVSEGWFRFLCPICREFNSAANPRTNLARCFRCQQNFNPIDLVMLVEECDFLAAVDYLQKLPRPAK